ncbi:hypothetical protein WN48_04095 [Eufriesea mexicana]|uniref:Uncharacterized protein n=1 Tax=Eufriesea mexicana TaxID=516756 RepID=A0A310SIR8_9HYME|nr:hypothetical protein WN48_04095 [Eufriesea mexicana]
MSTRNPASGYGAAPLPFTACCSPTWPLCPPNLTPPPLWDGFFYPSHLSVSPHPRNLALGKKGTYRKGIWEENSFVSSGLRRLAQHTAFRSTNVYGSLLEGWTANIVVIDVGWWPMCRYVDPAVSEFAFTSRTATRNMCSRPVENWRSEHMFPLKEKGVCQRRNMIRWECRCRKESGAKENSKSRIANREEACKEAWSYCLRSFAATTYRACADSVRISEMPTSNAHVRHQVAEVVV